MPALLRMPNDEAICCICNSLLQLKQISDVKAVYLCSDKACKYPLFNMYIVIDRRFEDMCNTKTDSINQLVDEVYETHCEADL